MSDVIIFIFGLLVTGMTVLATVMVGLSEAKDTTHTSEQDISEIEKRVVGDVRTDEQGNSAA